jgi:hypothetical protein
MKGRIILRLIFGILLFCSSILVAKSIDLKNITINISALKDSPIRFVDGEYSSDDQYDPLNISILETIYIDLNNDNIKDVVYLVNENTNGTGQFATLYLLINNGDKLIFKHRVIIGDRISIYNFEIIDNKIVVQYLDRAENASYASSKYINKANRYIVQDNQLIASTI